MTNSLRRTGFVYDDRFLLHDTGRGHPERPQRLEAIHRRLDEDGILARLTPIAARLSNLADAATCHDSRYLEIAQREIESGRAILSTGDTNVSPSSWEAALLAAGGVQAAVDAVIKGSVDNAFCAVRPPGHHATPTIGMGFCVMNSIAIAARYAQRHHGIGKVVIIDWDVHHGNGTQDIFYEDDSVLFFSTHQSPLYPGTGDFDEIGTGRGRGTTINCPLSAGTDGQRVERAFTEVLLPAVEKFKPELVLVSAGFDSRRGDPLGGFLLDDDDFKILTEMMLNMADQHADGHLVSVLEGGYSLTGVAAATAAHVTALGQPRTLP